jgi:hypothetical protein
LLKGWLIRSGWAGAARGHADNSIGYRQSADRFSFSRFRDDDALASAFTDA